MDTTKLMSCPTCGAEVPSGVYCVNCGALLHPVEGERGRHFSAAPHQHLLAPAIVSTLFPHLPSRGDQSFRALLAGGAALIGALALAGLYPVALIAAAVLVPLIVVLYLHEVDIYEGEPLRVIVATVAWGAIAGAATGLLRDALESSGSVLAPQTQTSAVLLNGVALPLIGLVLALAGPLALIRHRRYDDALDGVVFGAATAVSFAGAYLLAESSAFLGDGLAPTGLVEPWLLRLLTLGLALPVLAAAAVGGVAGSLWLRFRVARGERRAHRRLAHPMVSLGLAAVALCGAALLQIYLDRWAALVALLALDAVAIIWLRQLIHVGLTEELEQQDQVGPCPNCGRSEPRVAFCSYCGVAARALPKNGRAHGRAERVRLLARFAAALAVLIAVAVVVMAVAAPGGFRAPCSTRTGCATPPQVTGTAGSSPFTRLEQRTWRSAAGLRLSYDPRAWRTTQTGPSKLTIVYANSVELTVKTVPGSGQQQALDAQLASLRARYPDLALDSGHTPPSVSVGPLSAIGGLYAGHAALDGAPIEALVEVASAGGVTLVASAWTSQTAQSSGHGLATPFSMLASADAVLETVSWPAARRTAGRL